MGDERHPVAALVFAAFFSAHPGVEHRFARRRAVVGGENK